MAALATFGNFALGSVRVSRADFGHREGHLRDRYEDVSFTWILLILEPEESEC